MTKDTERALKAISKLAKELELEVTADDNKMYITRGEETTIIGISCNSTLATINEFIGYVFDTEWLYAMSYRIEKETLKDVKQGIRRYWIKDSISEGTR